MLGACSVDDFRNVFGRYHTPQNNKPDQALQNGPVYPWRRDEGRLIQQLSIIFIYIFERLLARFPLERDAMVEDDAFAEFPNS